MNSSVAFVLNASIAHGDKVHVLKQELCTIHIVQSPLCKKDEEFVLIECINRTWSVVVLTDDTSGWHWHELRNVIIDYATQYAFMHPDVFQDFLRALDSNALGDWDPTCTPSNSLSKWHPVLLRWEIAPFNWGFEEDTSAG